MLVIETLFLLASAEVFIAFSHLDAKLLRPLLYYQTSNLEVHRVSDDVILHYELRPDSSWSYPKGKVTINSLGFRDRKRSVRKPPGVFRIVCIGASNTYGALVDDDETYPALLEDLLNEVGSGRFEVWNAGVSAYVLSQNVRQAETILQKYSPDLLIFQLSNKGRRPFLYGQPFYQFLDRDPLIYRENLGLWPETYNFLRRWRFFRTLAIAANRKGPRPISPAFARESPDNADDAVNVLALRDFCVKNKNRVKMAFLVNPTGDLDPRLAETGIPAIDLNQGLPAAHDPEYDKIHPPAYVYRWYAAAIHSALAAHGLLPST